MKKFLKRFVSFLLFTLLVITSFSACGKKEDESEKAKELLSEFFTSTLSVTSKDGKLSFELSDGKITVNHPTILKGMEIYIEDGKIMSTLLGHKIELPDSFMDSALTLLKAQKDFENLDFSKLEFQDGKIIFENCIIEKEENFLIFKTPSKEFIIKKIK